MGINKQIRIIITGLIMVVPIAAWAFMSNRALGLLPQDISVPKETNPEVQKNIINTVPLPVFVGISLEDRKQDGVRFCIYIYDGHESHDYYEQDIKGFKRTSSLHTIHLDNNELVNDAIVLFLKHYQYQNHYKIVMAGLVKSDSTNIRTLARTML